jgi:hypothetical protein
MGMLNPNNNNNNNAIDTSMINNGNVDVVTLPQRIMDGLGVTVEQINQMPSVETFSMKQMMVIAYLIKGDLGYATFLQMSDCPEQYLIVLRLRSSWRIAFAPRFLP